MHGVHRKVSTEEVFPFYSLLPRFHPYVQEQQHIWLNAVNGCQQEAHIIVKQNCPMILKYHTPTESLLFSYIQYSKNILFS